MRLSAVIALLLGIPRLVAVFGTCCFDIQNGPQNPVMLRELLNRAAIPAVSAPKDVRERAPTPDLQSESSPV